MGASDSNRAVGRRRPSITEVFDEGHAIDEALRLGVQDALRRHKRLGQRVATWKNGRVVVLEPAEIRIEGSGTQAGSRARKARRATTRNR